MERIGPSAHTECIEHVQRALPIGIRRRLAGVHFVVNENPLWIGLHNEIATPDGRSYATTSHVTWKMHQLHLPASARETTVVLLDGDERDRDTILHELGHALDERLDFDRPDIAPLDSYAATNRREAFATAFQSWATPIGPNRTYFHTREQVMARDPAACAFFDFLAGN